jgi:hypothetical protein
MLSVSIVAKAAGFSPAFESAVNERKRCSSFGCRECVAFDGERSPKRGAKAVRCGS